MESSDPAPAGQARNRGQRTKTLASDAPTLSVPPYLGALVSLLDALKIGRLLGDDALHLILDLEPTPTDRKQLVMGLHGARLVSNEQCALMVHLFNLSEV